MVGEDTTRADIDDDGTDKRLVVIVAIVVNKVELAMKIVFTKPSRQAMRV